MSKAVLKEQLGNLLNDSLVDLIDFIKSSKTFVAGQVPEVLRQYIKYELISTILYSIGFLSVSICMAFLGVYFFEHSSNFVPQFRSESNPYFVGIFVASVCGVGFFVLFMCNVNYIIKLTVAPKVVLLDYLKSLVTDTVNK